DETFVGDPPFDGAIEMVDGELVARYPRSGRQIDRLAAYDLLLEQSLRHERQTVSLPVVERTPELTEADVDAARSEAELMLSAPVALTAPDGTTLTFTTSD